jgi:probable F420-dependent oxidoreductase
MAAATAGVTSKVKFGIATFVTDESIHPGRLGAALEERGFDSLFIAEHTHIPVSRETPFPGGGELPRRYYRTLDPFVALTAAAATTSELLLATGIALVPQRDVIHLAKQVASLDLVSGGRAVLGVGTGWNLEEMRNHGADPRTRGALANERLAALKAIWTHEQAEFHGEYVDFDPIFSWPKPVRRPHPPIYVGGETRPALDRLARYGDGWLPRPHTPPKEIIRVREWLADQGRTDVPVTVFALGQDPAAVAGYAQAGVERVTFLLRDLPESQALAELDELARLTG